MYCPKHRKPVKLKTTRTFDDEKKCIREKVCPKCKNRVMSIELFESDHNARNDDYEKQLERLANKIEDINSSREEVREAIKTLLDEVNGK